MPFKPKTYLGFPIGEDDSGPSSPDPRKKGVAIIIALFMITVMTLFMADMQLNAVVESQIAVANRDNLKAEYIAKSGANLATFLLNVDLAIDLTMAELGGANAQVSDGPGDLWAQLNGIPIGGETVELLGQMQETFDLSKVNDSGVLDQLKLFEGQFSMIITDETSRINVNYCGNVNLKPREECKELLRKLFTCPAEKDFFDKKKVNPEEVIGFIEDWIDLNQSPSESTGKGSENEVYTERRPRTQPKNAPLDTLDELRMVEGWDVDMHTIFSPYLTVHPIPSGIAKGTDNRVVLNFNSASRELLGCLFPKSTNDCAEKSALYLQERTEQGAAGSRAAVKSALQDKFCAEPSETTNILDAFTYRSDLYRVRVEGTAGEQKKVLEFVMERGLPEGQGDMRNQQKAAYKYLYWKML